MSHSFLIVDDSPIIRSVMKKSVMMSGLKVGSIHVAANGQEALNILDKEWIDIVFADINMPVMTGLELVERMSGSPLLASVPVVIVSSMNDSEKIRILKESGVKGYLRKPVNPEKIRDIAMKVLEPRGEQ